MTRARPCPRKTPEELSREWDRLAPERHRQISSHEDLSFDHVVVPTALRLLEEVGAATVVDVGAGTGEFTRELAHVARKVVAIEPSTASMRVARRVCQAVDNVVHVESTLEDSVARLVEERPVAATAVMVLMTAPDLGAFARALADILPAGAKFVAVLIHPCFWPKYCAYDTESWFRYEVETFIEAPFSISRHATGIVTTHIHRPLGQYLDAFAAEGFRLDHLIEPVPPPEVQALYPAPWRFPRFLGLRWLRSHK